MSFFRILIFIVFLTFSGFSYSDNHETQKEEVLNNEFYPMKQTGYNQLIKQLNILLKTDKCKSIKAMNQDLLNVYHEVPVDSPLSGTHLLSVMIYCNKA